MHAAKTILASWCRLTLKMPFERLHQHGSLKIPCMVHVLQGLPHASTSSNSDHAISGINGKACLAAMTEQRQACLDEAVSSPLLQLPDLVIAKLVTSLKHWKGSPLLTVCSSLRDAVIWGLRRARFAFAQHETQETAAANARLLSRVCSSSRPGLKVYLDTTRRHQDGEELLSILLKPGISLGGWSSVTHLNVGQSWQVAAMEGLNSYMCCCHTPQIITCEGTTVSLGLLSRAFPALKHLHLNVSVLLDWEGLRAWTQLTSLELVNCRDEGDKVGEGSWTCPSVNCPGPAILAELPSLTQVSLHTDCLHILADHLTRLTSLRLMTGYLSSDSLCPIEECVGRVVNNPNLQEVGLACEALDDAAEPHLQLLFNSCRHLRKLDLGLTVVNQPALDAILVYGTGITSLTAGELRAEDDRTTAPCGWQELWLSETYAPSHLVYLGNLPLHSVKRLNVGRNSTNTLQLPYSSVVLDAIPSMLHHAALNIANCPAWKESNASSMQVVAEPWTMPTGAQYSSGLSSQLIMALAPLAASPRITELEIDPEVERREVHSPVNFKWGAQQVRALAATSGTRLTSLRIGGSHLNPDFWPVIEEHLPSLRVLHLKQSVTFSHADLLAFGERPTSRPITVHIEMEQPEDLLSFERAMAESRAIGSSSGGGSSSTVDAQAASQQAGAGLETVQQLQAGDAAEVQGAEAVTAPASQGLSRHVLAPFVKPPTPPPVLTIEQWWEMYESGFVYTTDDDQDEV